VLLGAIQSGFGLLTWERDSFAYAESYHEDAKRYRGLRFAELVSVREDDAGLLVRPEAAATQIQAETAERGGRPGEGLKPAPPDDGSGPKPTEPPPPGPVEAPRPTRFHGSVNLDPARVGRDASRIADEVITHLVGLVGSNVQVTLEIEADIPSGAPDNVVRTVTENSRTLKFTSHGFEKE
jgi:hypothetical protein